MFHFQACWTLSSEDLCSRKWWVMFLPGKVIEDASIITSGNKTCGSKRLKLMAESIESLRLEVSQLREDLEVAQDNAHRAAESPSLQ